MTDEQAKELMKRAAKAGYWVGREDKYSWPDTPRKLEEEAETIVAAVWHTKHIHAEEKQC